jgi:hypothetical protein
MAVLKTVAVLPKLKEYAIPDANPGESDVDYDKRVSPLTEAPAPLSLTRSEADIVTGALKCWVKNAVLRINKHTVKLINEFSV